MPPETGPSCGTREHYTRSSLRPRRGRRHVRPASTAASPCCRAAVPHDRASTRRKRPAPSSSDRRRRRPRRCPGRAGFARRPMSVEARRGEGGRRGEERQIWAPLGRPWGWREERGGVGGGLEAARGGDREEEIWWRLGRRSLFYNLGHTCTCLIYTKINKPYSLKWTRYVHLENDYSN